MHKKKITKRQHKQATHRNPMTAYSLVNGDLYEIAGTAYHGKPKIFYDGKCLQSGMPFVRVHKKRAYVYGA